METLKICALSSVIVLASTTYALGALSLFDIKNKRRLKSALGIIFPPIGMYIGAKYLIKI